GVEHVGDAQAGFRVQRHAPVVFEQLAHGRIGNVAIAAQLVREAAHVAAALNVVLTAQRVHAHAAAANVAGRHGEVGNGHHGGRTLTVFGYAKAVVDRAVAAGGEQA